MTEKYKNQIDEKLINQLISQIDPEDLIEKDGILSVMKKKLVERALEAEMNHELGYIAKYRGHCRPLIQQKKYNRRHSICSKNRVPMENTAKRVSALVNSLSLL